MTRVAIIGNAGGGKSTLARKLSELFQLPLHSIDQLQWQPGWQAVSRKDFTEAHVKLIEKPCWIIDGWGDFDAIEERFRRSDTIILVDYPLWRHYWWAIKRQFRCLFRPRIDGPPGCPMIPMTWPLLKMLWAIDRHAMPKMRAMVVAQCGQKKVFHIRTLAGLRAFCAEAKQQASAAQPRGL